MRSWSLGASTTIITILRLLYVVVEKRSSFTCLGSIDHMKDKHMVQLEDGSWEPCRESWEPGGQDNRFIQEFEYKYVLKSNVTQLRLAKVYVERREWRRKCLWYIPWFAKKRQSLDVRFSAEVGERSGSWKGGCIGCGTDMKKGETAEQALRRMERERVFD